jgi:hypothetical protein
MSTYDVQDEEGPYYGGDMQDAVERARRKRAPSHIEEAVKSLEAEKPDEGYKPLPASARPYGPVEPPPPEPPSVAPPPEAPPFKPADFPVQTSAPAAPAGPSKSDALAQLQRMILSPSPASSGPGDGELVAAQQRDRQQSAQNDVTRAIQAWMFRKPFEPSAPTDEKNLLQRQSLADSTDAKGEQRRLSAQEALVKALTGDDKGLSLYQQAQLAEQARDNEYRSKHDTELAARHEEDAKRSQENIDVARQGVEAQRDFNRTMAGMTFSERQQEQKDKKERQVEEDTKDLAKTVGPNAGHLQEIVTRLKAAAAKPDVPGVGLLAGKAPDWMLSAEGVQNRNDMREAVRTMLTVKSGKTVTPQEAEDYARIYGISGTQEAFRQGVQRLEADIADTMKQQKAGFSPQAVQRFEQRGGSPTPEAPSHIATPPKGMPAGARQVNGKWYYPEGGNWVEWEAGD